MALRLPMANTECVGVNNDTFSTWQFSALSSGVSIHPSSAIAPSDSSISVFIFDLNIFVRLDRTSILWNLGSISNTNRHLNDRVLSIIVFD